MRKLSTKWFLKCLKADPKRQWYQSSEQLLEFFWHDPNDFLSRLVTMDKTWLYHFDLETKQQSMEWQHSGSPHPKKFWVQKSTGKFLSSIFWDQDGILFNCLPKGQTINAEYYLSLLVQLMDTLKEKHRRKVTKRVLFLRDIALAHRALAIRKKLAYLGFHCLDHPPFSPDLAPSDYHLFPGLKKQLKGHIFCLTWRSLLPCRPGWMDNILNFFWVACKSYSNGLRSVLSFVGSMLNKSRVWSL